MVLLVSLGFVSRPSPGGRRRRARRIRARNVFVSTKSMLAAGPVGLAGPASSLQCFRLHSVRARVHEHGRASGGRIGYNAGHAASASRRRAGSEEDQRMS
ncbi:hypothetical protein I6A84_05090 [Frankia sp. CNm7]|uniref:Uncharacterized protein n=1 Tax=Frankia nepalensis TaxID=1836974 RepID=A0A937RI54_9ACTN|nr:hypothetical protein [Frankia nepalensis]MBL7495540.1 hypothetical protein [Frankia nepalensis]MBL7509821.1 hypothetical protein [Frankia nepalensis]MBL7517514.1 hypothetical protein [Frankia nepalensis]MBL7626813.1 hypothetical protein [Frankia nepalensis]